MNSSNETMQCGSGDFTETLVGTIVPPIFALIVIIGVTGNALVVAVVLRHNINSTNLLILGLALSDLLFLLTCVPATALEYATFDFPYSLTWCRVQNYLQHWTAYVTVWTLVLMAVDRFMAVVYAIESLTYRSARNTLIALLALWVTVGVGVVAIAMDCTVKSYAYCGQYRYSCIYKYLDLEYARESDSAWRIKMFYFSFNAFGYVIPLVVSCTLYAKLLHRFWLTGRVRTPLSRRLTLSMRLKRGASNETHGGTVRQKNTASEARVKRQQKSKRRVTKMILGVIATFAGCWLPLNCCFFLHGWSNGRIASQLGVGLLYVQIVSQVLAYTNSCLNPILYAFLSDNYRHGFVTIFNELCCCLRRSSDSDDWAVTEKTTDSHRRRLRVADKSSTNSDIARVSRAERSQNREAINMPDLVM